MRQNIIMDIVCRKYKAPSKSPPIGETCYAQSQCFEYVYRFGEANVEEQKAWICTEIPSLSSRRGIEGEVKDENF